MFWNLVWPHFLKPQSSARFRKKGKKSWLPDKFGRKTFYFPTSIALVGVLGYLQAKVITQFRSRIYGTSNSRFIELFRHRMDGTPLMKSNASYAKMQYQLYEKFSPSAKEVFYAKARFKSSPTAGHHSDRTGRQLMACVRQPRADSSVDTDAATVWTPRQANHIHGSNKLYPIKYAHCFVALGFCFC